MSIIGSRTYWLTVSLLGGCALVVASAVLCYQTGVVIPSRLVYPAIAGVFAAATAAVAFATRRVF